MNCDTRAEERRRVGSPTGPLPEGDPMLLSLVYFVLRLKGSETIGGIPKAQQLPL
jgi:hypothetical protein